MNPQVRIYLFLRRRLGLKPAHAWRVSAGLLAAAS